MDKPNKFKYKTISLFTGIGGLDAGFGGKVVVHKKSISPELKNRILKKYHIPGFVQLKPTNFEVIFQNDILKGAQEVYSYNQETEHYSTESIFNLLKNKIPFPKADLILGGVPCNDWSHAGRRKGFQSEKTHNLKDIFNPKIENSRGMLYKSFVSVVDRVKPKMFVFENVYGLLTMKDEPINQIIQDFKNVGYEIEYQVMKSEEYGIPQTRKRVILLGIRKKGLRKELYPDWSQMNYNKIQCPVGPYFEHLQEPEMSQDLAQQQYSKAKRRNKGQGQVEVNLNSFSPTIRAEHHGNIEFRRHQNSPKNPGEGHLRERRLSLREAGLIQTFPPDFTFGIKKTMRSYKYIGNAVPPLLSYIIGLKVQTLLKEFYERNLLD